MPSSDSHNSATDTLFITNREEYPEIHSITEYACRELDTVFKDNLIPQELLLSKMQIISHKE